MKKLLFIIIILCVTSCSTYTYIPQFAQHQAPYIEIDEADKIPLYISSVNMTNSDNENIEVDPLFTNSIVNNFKSMDIFDQIIYTGSKKGLSDLIEVDIYIQENYQWNNIKNGIKGFLTGFTLFAIAPFTNYKYDYSLDFKYDFVKHSAAQKENKTIFVKSSKQLSRQFLADDGVEQLMKKVGLEIKQATETQMLSDVNYFTK